MAVPHYVYMVLKIPTELGILTLGANVSTAYDCEREGLAIPDAMDLSARMEACITDSKRAPAEELAILTQEPPRSATKSKDTKEVELVIGDEARRLGLGPISTPNRKMCSSASFIEMLTCLHGNLLTCLAFLRS